MRRLATLATAALLFTTGACSSDETGSTASRPTTTVPSALAKWLDSLSPPLPAFVDAQSSFVDAVVTGDTNLIKTASVGVTASARALSASLKAAPPPDEADQVTAIEGLLDQLVQLGTQVSGCATADTCGPQITQFTTTFTEVTRAINELQTTARPVPTPVAGSGRTTTTASAAGGTTTPTSGGTGSTAPGGTTRTTGSVGTIAGTTPTSAGSATTVTAAPRTPELTTWINTYGNGVINTAKALGTLARSLSSTDVDVVNSACAGFVSRVNATYAQPTAPNAAVAGALTATMNRTASAYAVCRDDPDIIEDNSEDTIRQDFYDMGEAIPTYVELIRG